MSQPANARNRCFEMVEAFLLHGCRKFGTVAAEARGLVRDQATAGLLHRRRECRNIERRECANVDDLAIDAGLFRRGYRDMDERAVGDDR